MPGLCYPYGSGIECTCSVRGTPVHCLPVLDYEGGFYQDGEYTVGDVGEYAVVEEGKYVISQERWLGESEDGTWTEIVLLITLIMMILLSFTV